MTKLTITKWDGKPIVKAGLYSGIPIETYHGNVCASTSISSSGLRTIFRDSPAHYYAEWVQKADDDDKKLEKEAFVLGRAAHHLFLGEDNWSKIFIERPDTAPDGRAWNGNNKGCIEWMQWARTKGYVVLTNKQINQIRGMARSLAEQPLVKSGILNGEIEISGFWQDEKTGVWLRIRPDTIPEGSLDFVDLKTSARFGDDLGRSIYRSFRYDMQGALVRMGMRQIARVDIESFTLVFVEKNPPHSVEVVSIPKESLSKAEDDVRIAIDTFAHCLKHDRWFGPSGTQLDAHHVYPSQMDEAHAMYRRDILKKEIAS